MNRDFNPALDTPLRDIPFTLIATRPIGFVYYYEFQSEPSLDEYAAAGAAIQKVMLAQIGFPPLAWLLIPTVEVNLDFFRGQDGFREPVQVVSA